jgi:hypothetical protein
MIRVNACVEKPKRPWRRGQAFANVQVEIPELTPADWLTQAAHPIIREKILAAVGKPGYAVVGYALVDGEVDRA